MNSKALPCSAAFGPGARWLKDRFDLDAVTTRSNPVVARLLGSPGVRADNLDGPAPWEASQ